MLLLLAPPRLAAAAAWPEAGAAAGSVRGRFDWGRRPPSGSNRKPPTLAPEGVDTRDVELDRRTSAEFGTLSCGSVESRP